MRKLASVVQIEEIKPIDGADKIEVARVKNWWVVVKKDEYIIGDLAVYFEIDSWIPHNLAPFLSGSKIKSYNGVEGNKLRTIKLRGQLSQGLLLPMSVLPSAFHDGNSILSKLEYKLDDDVTEVLNIQLWEQAIPASLYGTMKGSFPSFVRKTDQERVQNMKIDDLFGDFYVTEKLDGSSMTIYRKDGIFGVCSRNIELKTDQEGNSFVNMFTSTLTDEFIKAWEILEREYGEFAIQGELLGFNIQGNKYQLNQNEFRWYPFSIWNIEKQSYMSIGFLKEFCEDLGLIHVPIVYENIHLDGDVSKILDLVQIGSFVNNKVLAEGCVFTSTINANDSFKAISNAWLLKYE